MGRVICNSATDPAKRQPRQRKLCPPRECRGLHLLKWLGKAEVLVGVAGFEPATPSSRTGCITPNPLIFRVSPTRFTLFCSLYFVGFLGILGRVLATFSRAIERLVNAILKVRMMVPVVLAQRLLRHA
jgi:hypothetical protein